MKNVNDLSINEMMSDDEPNYIAQEIMRRREPISKEVWMLDLLAQTQFSTAGQLCRVKHKDDFLEGCKVLKSLVDAGLIGTIKNVKIKYGIYKGRSTTVYFLSGKGKKSLKFYFPRTARYAQSGFPNKISHSRINHQLLVAEAYLFYSDICLIVKCESEDVLKGDFQTQNDERRRAGQKRIKTFGGFPDLKIAFIKRGDSSGTVRVVSIEACVNLSSRQIAVKSNDYDWFVFDKSVAARILDIKKDYATIADDVLAPLEAEMFFKRGTGGNREKKTKNYATMILDVLDAIGGGATKQLIESETGIRETTLRNELEKLVAAKILCKTETSLVPGISRGRNHSFYYRPNENADRNFIIRQTIRCYAVGKLAKTGFTSFSVNYLFAMILTNDETGEEAALLTDFEEFTDREFTSIQRRMTPPDEERTFRNTYKGCKIIYASYNLSNIRKTTEKYPNTYVLDLCEERAARSYRFKIELNSGTITRDNRQRAD